MIEWDDEGTATHTAVTKRAIDTLGAVCLAILLALAFIAFH
jgi:hypothetical protein